MLRKLLDKFSTWTNQSAQIEQLKAENDRLAREHSSHKSRADLAELGLKVLGLDPKVLGLALEEDFHTHYLMSCVDVNLNSVRMKEKTGLADISGWETFYEGLRYKAPDSKDSAA